MIINLMLPTRGRPDLAYRFCKSVKDTASNTKNIIVTVLVDADDTSYTELQEKLNEFNFIKYLPQANVQSFPGLTWYWDQIIAQTINESDIFGMVADDMVFRDKDWDKLVEKFFSLLPDKIGLIHFNALNPQGARICINSFIHKRYIEITGSYNDSRLKGDFADDFLYYIFSYIDRMGYVPNNIIEHMHYDYGKMQKDDTAVRRRSADANLYEGMTLKTFFRKRSIPLANSYIKKLERHLSNIKDKNTGLSKTLSDPQIIFIPESRIRDKYSNKLIRSIHSLIKKWSGYNIREFR